VVEVHISHLRKKIDTGRTPMINTIRGAGYVLKPD
jgi:two-component system OmpR family response regulator